MLSNSHCDLRMTVSGVINIHAVGKKWQEIVVKLPFVILNFWETTSLILMSKYESYFKINNAGPFCFSSLIWNSKGEHGNSIESVVAMHQCGAFTGLRF